MTVCEIRITEEDKLWWAELDSNQRSGTQRIYNPPPLTTRTPTLVSIYLHTAIIKKDTSNVNSL